MILVRQVLGDQLRRHRLAQSRTLRDVSRAARVSLGYLSEVERGRKEPSSELLGSICGALSVPLSVVLRDVSDDLALQELIAAGAGAGVGVGASAGLGVAAGPGVAAVPSAAPTRPVVATGTAARARAVAAGGARVQVVPPTVLEPALVPDSPGAPEPVLDCLAA